MPIHRSPSLALAAATAVAPAAALEAWILDAHPGESPVGNVCVAGGSLCSAGAHFVVNVKPSSPLDFSVVGGGDVSLDGGATWFPGPSAIFETHLNCDNTTQVWAWDWEWVLQSGDPAGLPSQVCARLWFQETASGAAAAVEAACYPATTATVAGGTTSAAAASLLFGNVTLACSRGLGLCRALVSAALDVALPSVVGPVTGGGAYSLDKGTTWAPGGDLENLGYYDSAEVPGGLDTFAQRFHWALDLHRPFDAASDEAYAAARAELLGWGEVCYSIWVNGAGQSAASNLAGPLYVAMNVSETTWPSGYAKSNSVRCWPVSEVLDLP